MSPIRLFISHANEDKELADTLLALLSEIFKDTIAIYYSSDDGPGGGIRAGGTWLEWIMTTVRHTDVCIVILTEDSASAPWVTWETGAVTGVALGSDQPPDATEPTIRVVPLTFGIAVDRVPAPLQHQQAVRGDRETGVRKLLFMLRERCGQPSAPARESDDRSVAAFVETVRDLMERRTRDHPVRLQAADFSVVHLLNCKQGLTLEPRDGEIADGVRLQCGAFTGDAHQRWLLHRVDLENYRITTADRTKCLSIQNDSKKAGAAVILWDYVAHASQHWQLRTFSSVDGVLSTISLVNTFSGLLMSSAIDGNDIVQAKRVNKTNEDWWMLLQGRL